MKIHVYRNTIGSVVDGDKKFSISNITLTGNIVAPRLGIDSYENTHTAGHDQNATKRTHIARSRGKREKKYRYYYALSH